MDLTSPKAAGPMGSSTVGFRNSMTPYAGSCAMFPQKASDDDGDGNAGDGPHAEVKPPGGILFVDKLSPTTEDATLKKSFSRFGTVISAQIARDMKNGDSLCWGFVELMTKENCELAVMLMNGSIIDGRKIKVNLSSHECRESKQKRNKEEALCNSALKRKGEWSADAHIVATQKKRTGMRGKWKDEAAEVVPLPNCSIHNRKFSYSEGAYSEEQTQLGAADEAVETEAKQQQMEFKGSFPEEYEITVSELDSAWDAKDKDYRVGAGSFGIVYRLTMKGQKVAVKYLKEMSAEPKEQERSMRAFHAEVDVLSKLKHCNLVQLIGVCEERRAIIYEFLPNGNLHDRMLLHGQKFSWKDRINVALDICSALQYLQDRTDPIVHGDITPANILFDDSNVAKLGDFGISRILVATTDSGTKIHLTNNTPTGTAYYVDPEYMITSNLTKESDIFALGVILMQLVSGKGAKDLRDHIHNTLASEIFWKKDQGQDEKEHMVYSLRKVQLIDRKIKLPIMDGLELLKLGRDCTWNSRKRRASLKHVFDTLRSLSAH